MTNSNKYSYFHVDTIINHISHSDGLYNYHTSEGTWSSQYNKDVPINTPCTVMISVNKDTRVEYFTSVK